MFLRFTLGFILLFFLSCDKYKDICSKIYDQRISVVSDSVADRYKCDKSLVMLSVTKSKYIVCGKIKTEKIAFSTVCSMASEIISRLAAVTMESKWKCQVKPIKRDVKLIISSACKLLPL